MSRCSSKPESSVHALVDSSLFSDSLRLRAHLALTDRPDRADAIAAAPAGRSTPGSPPITTSSLALYTHLHTHPELSYQEVRDRRADRRTS